MTEEKFSSAGNRVLGVIGVALGVTAIVAILANGPGREEMIAVFAIGLFVTLFWAFLLRPQIRLTPTTLTLRNALDTVAVPVRLVTAVEVRRYTVIGLADSTRLTSTAMSRGFYQLARHDRGRPAPGDPADFMTARIRSRIEESSHTPAGDDADAGIRRTPALPELAVLVACALGVVVSLLL